MDVETFLRMLSASENSELNSPQESEDMVDLDDYIDNLKRLHISLNQTHQFKVGDIVMWKEGLKNKRVPEYQQPVIVLEVLDKPFYDEKAEVGSPYFRDKLDFVLGIVTKEGFLTFHYDSKRFKPFKKSE